MVKAVPAAMAARLNMYVIGESGMVSYLCWEGLALLEVGATLAPSTVLKPSAAAIKQLSKLGVRGLKVHMPYLVITNTLLEHLGTRRHCSRGYGYELALIALEFEPIRYTECSAALCLQEIRSRAS